MGVIGSQIKYFRKKKGYTLKKLGEAIGVSEATAQRYESGHIKRIPYEQIEKMAALLGCAPEQLIGWEKSGAQGAYEGEGKTVSLSPSSSSSFSSLPLSSLSASPLPKGAFTLETTRRIPVLGRVAAGLPMVAEQQVEEYISVDYPEDGAYFGLLVRGDSMDAAGIASGDVVVVRIQDTVENGDIAVVMVDGGNGTVKRFRREGSIVVLLPQSRNPDHHPQIYNLKDTTLRIAGKVVEVRKRF